MYYPARNPDPNRTALGIFLYKETLENELNTICALIRKTQHIGDLKDK